MRETTSCERECATFKSLRRALRRWTLEATGGDPGVDPSVGGAVSARWLVSAVRLSLLAPLCCVQRSCSLGWPLPPPPSRGTFSRYSEYRSGDSVLCISTTALLMFVSFLDSLLCPRGFIPTLLVTFPLYRLGLLAFRPAYLFSHFCFAWFTTKPVFLPCSLLENYLLPPTNN